MSELTEFEKQMIRMQEHCQSEGGRIDRIERTLERSAIDHASYSKDTDKRIGELAMLSANQGLELGALMRALYWLIAVVFSGVVASVLGVVLKHGG